MSGTIFATLDDYMARYGTPDNPDRVEVALADASALMLSAYERRRGDYIEGLYPRFDRAATAVCCAVVARALSTTPSMDGVSAIQQTAGSYSASLTYGTSGSTRARLWQSDLRDLGLAGSSVYSIPVAVGNGDECDV